MPSLTLKCPGFSVHQGHCLLSPDPRDPVHFSGAIYIPEKTAWWFEAQTHHLTAALTVGTQNGGKQPAHSPPVNSKNEGTSTNNMICWGDPDLDTSGGTGPLTNIYVQSGPGQNRQAEKTSNCLPRWSRGAGVP